MTETLLDSLSARALREPGSPVVTFVDRGDGEPQVLTALGLDQRARSVAAALAAVGARGDRALIVCPPGLDFVGAFYGCLFGGFVAVPCPAPVSPSKSERLRGILLDTRPTVILTVDALEATLHRALADCPGHASSTVCVDLLPPSLADGYRGAPVDLDEIAFLQFTSGSTRTPRGVMVSHGNLMANIAMIEKTFGVHDGQCGVSWLPVYHDMGLVSLLLLQHLGNHSTILPPESFVADPLQWLRLVAASDRPVVNAAPVFALDFCLERLRREDLEGLDLARWDALICGAEPIRNHAVERFAKLLEPTGFRRSAMHAAYGLAEATLFVCAQPGSDVTLEVDRNELERGALVPSGLEPGRGRGSPRPASLLTGCGRVRGDSDIVVVDPKSLRPLPDAVIGEVWVSGPQVARGYWGDPARSADVFDARIGDSQSVDGGGYLRTGDLGAVCDGQLYVTGRLKDLILIRGRNIYPSDVEQVASCAHESCVAGMSAAFSLLGEDREDLIVLQGVSPTWIGDFTTVTEAIRRAVVESCEVEPHAVALVSPSRIPRTTSGKVRRGRCCELWSRGQLEVIYEEQSVSEGSPAGPETAGSPTRADIRAIAPAARASAIAQWLIARVADASGLPPWRVGADDVLQGLGLDSVKITRLISEIASALDVRLGGGAFTIRELAAEIACAIDVAESDASRRAHVDQTSPPERGIRTGAPSAREDRHAPFPLTDLQRAYLVGRSQAFELGGISANVYFEFDAGEREPVRLGASLRRIIERHEMLRAVIDPAGLQRILPLEEVDWERFGLTVTDMRAATDAEARSEILAVRKSMIEEQLDLHSGPLFRALAVLQPDGKTSLHVGFDLLIADMASLRIFFSEWGALYTDHASVLQPLELSFRDWVIERQASLAADGVEIRRAKEYWRELDADLPGAPELPTVVSSSGAPQFSRRERRLAADAVAKIRDLAGAHGVSLSIALLSAYAAALARWSRSQRFTLGVTLYDRPASSLGDSVIGDFTSLELLEIDLVSPSSFVDLAVATQRRLWQDLAHRAYPGTCVLRDLAARNTGATRAAMPVVFTGGIGLSGHDRPTEWLGKLVLNISRTPQVMLDNQLIEDGEDLLLIWDSVDSLFPGDVLDDMFAGYVGLVEALTREPRWQGSPTVDPAVAPMRLHTEVNEAVAGSLTSELLHQRVLSVASSNPYAPAVIADDRTVTFGELVNHALSAADALSRSGVARGSLVGIAMTRGWRCIAGMLAALLSGAAYCPIDLEQPEQRRRTIVENAKIDCLIVEREQTSDIPWLPGDVPVLSMPVEPSTVARGARDGFTACAPDEVAYVIYTSGSTGCPKGVAVSHRAARNTCDDICERYGVTEADRVLALSSTAFDLSVFDIFGVLGAGGAVVIPRPASSPDPSHWCQLIRKHCVTVWNSVPALAEMLVDHMAAEQGEADRALPLRLALLSGDWIALALPERIKDLAPDVEVVSLGGATEAAIWSLHHPIETVDLSMSSIPYGTPLRNQTVHVLNERLEPCPALVAGALYIGGAGLALGYWHDQSLTQERFITHPASGERLYRTGDLARWRPEGMIELLGREDFQLKIAGQRVELGEIEQVLLEHPHVKQAAVVASGERRRQQLVAFVTGGGNGDQADPGEMAQNGFISDPVKRLEFKLRRPGRRDLDDRRLVSLTGSQWWSEDSTRRVSQRSFATAPLESGLLGGLLSVMRAREDGGGFARHAYASADGLYPVQLYLQIMRGRVTGLDAGVYYYDPGAHRLALLAQDDRLAVERTALVSLADEPAFLIYLVASSSAIEPLYGSLWRDFALIEVGLICQLLEDTAVRHRLGLCQLGGSAPASRFAELLDLGAKHELLHVVAGGAPRIDTNGHHPSSNGSVTKASSLRSYLRSRLPAHMVPLAVMELDAMPLTDTGKLDRGALQVIAAEAGTRGSGYVDPVGDVERLVVSQIEAVLGIERVGATDNLFDLGANSLALVEIHRCLREQLEQDFSLLTIFECPNARALAAQLAGHGAEARATERGRERSRRRGRRTRSSRERGGKR